MKKSIYITFIIVTNFLWGLTFLIPYILIDINPVAIAVGRYIAFGLIACTMAAFYYNTIHQTTRRDWLTAFYFAFFGNIGNYMLLVFAIHYVGISVVALILGTTPIGMMILGSYIEGQVRLKKIYLPLIMILMGLIVLNWHKLNIADDIEDTYIIYGIVLSIAALLSWIWYGVYNARYLKIYQHITSQYWTILIGICSFIQAIIVIIVYFMIFKHPFFVNTDLHFSITTYITLYITASLIMAIVVTGLATLLLNVASRNLPIALVGQLMVFETIASILYEHIWDQNLPTYIETISMGMIIIGIIYGLRINYSTQ